MLGYTFTGRYCDVIHLGQTKDFMVGILDQLQEIGRSYSSDCNNSETAIDRGGPCWLLLDTNSKSYTCIGRPTAPLDLNLSEVERSNSKSLIF